MVKSSRSRPRSLHQQLLDTQNTILEQLRQDVAEWQRAGERYDRQHRATLRSLTAIQQSIERQTQFIATSTQTLATMLQEIHTVSARTLELTRDIHLRMGNGGTTTH
jgi:hypothetical protein